MQLPKRLGYRWRCISDHSLACERGTTSPGKRTKCRYCGGALLVRRGVYAVVEWSSDGRYSLVDAEYVSASERIAQRRCDEMNDGGNTCVVRFMEVRS